MYIRYELSGSYDLGRIKRVNAEILVHVSDAYPPATEDGSLPIALSIAISMDQRLRTAESPFEEHNKWINGT
ncbi:hypothetical protein JCM18750_41250 [Halostagnicola bangensis]